MKHLNFFFLCLTILALPSAAAAGPAFKFGSYEGFPDDLRPAGIPAHVRGNLKTGNRAPNHGTLEQVYLWKQRDADKKEHSGDVRIRLERDVKDNRMYGHQYVAFQQIQGLAMTVLYDGYYKGAAPTSAASRVTILRTNIKEKEIGVTRKGVGKRSPQRLLDGNYHFIEWKSSPVSPQWSWQETHHFAVQAGNVFIHAETTYPAGTTPLISVNKLVKEIAAKLPRTGDLPPEISTDTTD